MCLNANRNLGEPKLIVDNNNIAFQFNSRKLFETIRKPADEKLKTLLKIEITAITPYQSS